MTDTTNVEVRDINGLIRVRFRYDVSANAIIRQVPNGEWRSNIGAWVFPSSEMPAVQAAVAAIEPILAKGVEAEKIVEDMARDRSVKMPPPSAAALAAARKRIAARRGR
jgi:hypothetical protein